MTHVIIVAAGRGSRFGGDLPKQFCLLDGRPVLMHTIDRVRQNLPGAQIALVLSKESVALWQSQCEEYSFDSPHIVCGGDTRWESVRNALAYLNAADDDIVMVHDGVRPIIGKAMIDRLTQAIKEHRAAVPAIPVTDSLRQICADGASSKAVDRSGLRAVQTPQAFLAKQLNEAYRLPFSPEFTDDASVFEAAGFGSPAMVEGEPTNIKITHPCDIEIASIYLKNA